MRNVMTAAMAALLLAGCNSAEPTVEGRWYSQAQVDLGKQVFSDNCATCHGAGAQGMPNWQVKSSNGRYPAPPLNGTAHAWHHPLRMLEHTVQKGGVPMGGWMPAFGDQLSEQEQKEALAWVQSLWPEQIYQAWEQRGGLK